MASILLLEDDKALSKGIKIALQKDNHIVTIAASFFDGVEAFVKNEIDLYLLDINLPDGNGLEFCKKLREHNQKPIIFITANDTEKDMLYGFEAGCDDYIAKPFSIQVLRQKILAVLRRITMQELQPQVFSYHELEIHFDKKTIYKNNKVCKLTATEYRLLEYMVRNKGKVLTREMLLEQLWDIDGNFIDENTLSVHVRRLRQKLETNAKDPEYILTVFGIGYTFGD